jgi:hypothetical protein
MAATPRLSCRLRTLADALALEQRHEAKGDFVRIGYVDPAEGRRIAARQGLSAG